MTKKRRHHYIPRFYLEGFIDPVNEPYIWIYEKGNPTVRRATIDDIAVQKDYYSFIDIHGKKDTETYEDALAEVESKLAPAIKKIKDHENLTNEDKGAFAVFLGLTLTRVPNFRENIQKTTGELLKAISMILALNSNNFKSYVEKVENDTGEKIGMPLDDLRKFILEGKYNVHVDPQHSLPLLILAGNLAPIFCDMKWAFFKATDNDKFVTSDNPLFRVDPTYQEGLLSGMGLLNKNIEVTLPISKDLTFLGTWGKSEGYYQADNDFIKEVNRRTIISALRFVFASQNSNELNKLVQKYKNNAPKMKVEEII